MTDDKEIQQEMNALRENLRILETEVNTLRAYISKDKCPYGMQKDGVCTVGIPGCGCMDDVMAWESSKIDPLIWVICEALNGKQGWRKRAIARIEPYIPVDSIPTEVTNDRESIVTWMRNTVETYRLTASSEDLETKETQPEVHPLNSMALASLWSSIADLIESCKDKTQP